MAEVETELKLCKVELEYIRQNLAFRNSCLKTLLGFIREFSLDIKEIGADEFKKEIDELIDYFIFEERVRKLHDIFEEFKSKIKSYIIQEKDYLSNEADEFKNIIKSLTEVVFTVNQDDKEFNTEIKQHGDKLEEINNLNDIKEIKCKLKSEVKQLRRVVKEKETRDSKQIENLSNKVKGLKSALKEATIASMTDKLTGAYNRMAFDAQMNKIVNNVMVRLSTFSVIMLDIDNFKSVNDTYGHQVGDSVIVETVARCKAFLRKDDFVARYGGEEFVIILHDTSLRNAKKKAKYICKAVSSDPLILLNSGEPDKTLSFTISLGVSTLWSKDTVESVIGRADKALYHAKRIGKNCVACEKDLAA